MNFSRRKISIFVIVNCIFLFSCNHELIKKWGKFNNRPPNIELEKRGTNGVGGNYLIESSSYLDSRIRKDEYYLKNAEGQTHKLDIELNWEEYQILYFTFTQNSLFIIINSFAPRDWITLKNFSLETGELIFSDIGVIPCEKKTEMIGSWKMRYDWSLGNRKCNWINFQSQQISFLRSGLVSGLETDSLKRPLYEFNIFSYNWQENKLDTLPRNFSIFIDAVTGNYLHLRNIQYNSEKGQFEY